MRHMGIAPHCDVAGWEFESSAIGDALDVDGAFGSVEINGNAAEDLIFRPEGPTVASRLQAKMRSKNFEHGHVG